MADVKRTIHFLKVASEVYNFSDLLQEIGGLTGSPMYSILDGRGGGIFLKSVIKNGDMYEGVIGRLRMDNLPSVGRHGDRLTAQLSIAEDQGLVECTHFTYFENSGILAMEYNHHGPKASTLHWHMTEKTNTLHSEPPQLIFQPVFDEEVMNVLSEGYEIRALRIKVPKERIGNLAAFDPSVHAAFENARHFGDGAEVEMIIRMTKSSGRPFLGDRLLGKIRGMAGEPKDTFDTLDIKVKRPDERIRTVDLLEGKFIVNVTIPTSGRSNEVNADAMFLEMREAYQLRREDLRRMTQYENLA